MDYKKIFCLFCVVMGTVCEGQSISSSVVFPYTDNQKTYFLISTYFSDPDLINASRFDFFSSENIREFYALSYFRATPDIFIFDGVFLELPTFSTPVPIDAIKVPAFFEGFSFKRENLSVTFGFVNGFIPEIGTEIETQKIILRPDPFIGTAGSIGIHDVNLSFLWVSGKGSLNIEETNVGSVTGSLALVSGDWDNFGFFYVTSQGLLSVAAYALVTDTIGFSALSSGVYDIHGFGGWGAISYSKRRFNAELYSVAGVFWTSNTTLEATTTINGVSQKRNYQIEWDPSVLIILHPTVSWSVSDRIVVNLGRWLPYQCGWDINTKGEEDVSSGTVNDSGLTQKKSFLDTQSLLFSGFELSMTWLIK